MGQPEILTNSIGLVCRNVCSVDASTIVRVRAQLSYTEILTSTEESVCDGLYISHRTSFTRLFQLVADIEARVGIGWSRSHTQHLMVAHCHWPIVVHLHYQVRWCLEWLLHARFCRLIWLRQAFFSFCRHVMVHIISPTFYNFLLLSTILINLVVINCSLEFWYLMVLVVITGRLADPLIPVDAISVW